MQGRLKQIAFDGSLCARLQTPPSRNLTIYWLGQAGFIIDIDGKRLVIDPYLSDSLAQKYKGTARPHTRMMPPPVAPDEIGFVDLVLCTHGHTDHMDAATLQPLLAGNSRALVIAPRALHLQVLERSGIATDQLIEVNAGERLTPLPGLSIGVTASAHEDLEIDADGNHRFLGYVITGDNVRLWHSGDCVDYPGLDQELKDQVPDIALLPVNGRRRDLKDHGVPGNFTLFEAIKLARLIGATDMLAHHYGLFDFNTEDPQAIDDAIVATTDLCLHRAQTGIAYSWQPA